MADLGQHTPKDTRDKMLPIKAHASQLETTAVPPNYKLQQCLPTTNYNSASQLQITTVPPNYKLQQCLPTTNYNSASQLQITTVPPNYKLQQCLPTTNHNSASQLQITTVPPNYKIQQCLPTTDLVGQLNSDNNIHGECRKDFLNRYQYQQANHAFKLVYVRPTADYLVILRATTQTYPVTKNTLVKTPSRLIADRKTHFNHNLTVTTTTTTTITTATMTEMTTTTTTTTTSTTPKKINKGQANKVTSRQYG
ncbi:leucine-rich repeat-containing protein AAC1-like [Penaeus vannamei]|uniref:leucine-rich repeat-containing protein AAC1-like n=1 Tax=Penaeus vannamei TaxID=6689 RepID=UPI00387F90AD